MDSVSFDWQLRADAYAVVIGDDLVLLDAQADAYYCLAGASGELRLDSLTGAVAGAAGSLSALRDAGLVERRRDRPLASRRPLPPMPTESALALHTPRPDWRDLQPAISGVVSVLLGYRGRSFIDILRLVERPDRPFVTDASPGLFDVVAQFHRWAPYAPVSGKCLLRSFMLLHALRRAGHDAEWVFGVSTWPFGAHCWLQCGPVALDDSPERLGLYHPILAV